MIRNQTWSTSSASNGQSVGHLLVAEDIEHEITQVQQNILSKSAMSNDVQEEQSSKYINNKDSSVENQIIQKT